MIFRTFLLFFLILVSVPSYAAKINEEGAAHLKAQFEAFIAEQKEFFPENSPYRLVFEGDVDVEMAKDYYAVTLPYLKYMMEITDKDGKAKTSYMDVGMISVNAAPHKNVEGQWKTTLALPTPITLFDDQDNPLMQVKIGGQRAAGIWDESLKNFVKLDALYSDIAIGFDYKEPSAVVSIPELIVRMDGELDDKNLWSGPMLVLLKDFNMQGPDDTGSLKLGLLKFDMTADQFDFKAWRENSKKFAALANQFDPEKPDPKLQAEFQDTLFDMYFKGVNGMRFEYAISDLEMNRKATPGNDGAESVSLKHGVFGGHFSGLFSDMLDAGLQMGFSGLKTENAGSGPADLSPDAVNFDVSVHNVPFKEIAGLASNSFQAVAQNPEMKSMAFLSMMVKVPALLSQAKSHVEIDNNFVSHSDYRFEVDGDVKADMSAVNSATADLQGQFKGLDGLTRRVQNLAINGAEDAKRYALLLRNLQMMQALGKKDTGGDVYLYDFEMNPQGQMLMNGQDMRGLMGGGAGGER